MEKQNEKNIRVSAINWDSSLPSDTYFGFHQTRTLSPKKYRTVTPYYADVLGENQIGYHLRNQEEIDRELRYAIEAGIDYFSYVFYPDEGSCSHITTAYEDCSAHVHELNHARKMHQSSALRNEIGMAAIIGAHPFAKSDYEALAALLQEPYYEKVNGRPIVYLFWRILPEDINGVLRAVEKLGGEKPLFFVMRPSISEANNLSLVDGVSCYACCAVGVENHCDLLNEAMQQNEDRAKSGMLNVPLFPMGWDPRPRIDIPSPWVKYPAERYAKAATAEELLFGAERFAKHINETPCIKEGFIGHVMMFAWNEFEEGGWICPTYNEDLSLNTERLGTVSAMIRCWKKTLA